MMETTATLMIAVCVDSVESAITAGRVRQIVSAVDGG